MRFIAFAPAQAGLSLFAHLFFPFTPAMNIPFTPIHQTRLAHACPARASPLSPSLRKNTPYIVLPCKTHQTILLPNTPCRRLPQRAIFTPPPQKKNTTLPFYITLCISNHIATKRNLLALAPIGHFHYNYPISPKTPSLLSYITSCISNHIATKRNLLALAPKGLSLFPSPPQYSSFKSSIHQAQLACACPERVSPP